MWLWTDTQTRCLAKGHEGHTQTAVPGAVDSPSKADGATSICVSHSFYSVT